MTFKELFATDKLLHASACFVLTVLFAAILSFTFGHIAYGAIGAILVGVGKEVYDVIRGGKFDIWDLAYDVMGAAFAGFLLMFI